MSAFTDPSSIVLIVGAICIFILLFMAYGFQVSQKIANYKKITLVIKKLASHHM